MENSIALRIKELIEEKKLNISSFERKIGVGNNSIGTIINKNSNVSGAILSKILNSYNDINANWLITGKGEMIIENKEIPIATFEEPKPTYGKEEKTDFDLLVKNNSLLKEQNQLQEEVIIMLREKAQFFEEKYNDCENQKKLLATSKKMD